MSADHNPEPDPIESDSPVPPALEHTHLGTVAGRLAVWSDTRAVAGTLRGLYLAAVSGEVSPERALTACGDLAERLDALVDGLSALGPDTTPEDPR